MGSSLASFTVTDSDQTSCTLAANPTTSLQYFTLSSEWYSVCVCARVCVFKYTDDLILNG